MPLDAAGAQRLGRPRGQPAGAGLDRSSSEPPPPGHAPRGEYSADYYNVRPRDRALVAFVYLGLIAALVVGMQGTHIVRHVS